MQASDGRGGVSQLDAWHRVGLRQLSGMLLIVLARRDLRAAVGCVMSSAVPCGVGGFGGNKGAVAVSLAGSSASGCCCSTATSPRIRRAPQLARHIRTSSATVSWHQRILTTSSYIVLRD